MTGPDEMAARAPAGRGRIGWLRWAAPPAAGLLVVSGVCLPPGCTPPRLLGTAGCARPRRRAGCVRRGDTPKPSAHPTALSPSGSSIATLVARADAVYAANAEAIGGNPSHLASGTALVIPAMPYAG